MKLSNLVDPRVKEAIIKLNKSQIPLKAAFKLKGIIGIFNAEYKKYEDVRSATVLKYGKKKEDGSLDSDENGNVTLEGENAQLFVSEINDLLIVEIEFPKISLSELGDGVSISSEEIGRAHV